MSFGWCWSSSSNNNKNGPVTTTTTTNKTTTCTMSQSAAWHQKEEEIMTCLRGNEQQEVNLWHLRELALSPGGLVSPECRKRAWPKLVAIHEAMMMDKSSSNNNNNNKNNNTQTTVTTTVPPQCTLSRSLLLALQTDLRTTVWNVQAELQARKEARQREQALIDQRILEEFLRNRRVKFAAADGNHNNNNNNQVNEDADPETNPPEAMYATPTNSEHDEEDEDDYGNISGSGHFHFSMEPNSVTSSAAAAAGGTLTPSSIVSHDSASLVSLLSTSSISSSRAIRGRKATVHERRILYTLLTKLLQTAPPPLETKGHDVDYVDSSYTYQPGFQDLVAILLFNLESPTVTSLVLPKLASHHWRPLLSSKSHLEAFLSALFMPLLEEVDHRLAQHLQAQGLKLPTFCRSWVATWFASDTTEAAAASRLLDVLIVSHPFMVIYLSVAWVTQRRSHLLSTTDFVVLAKTLRALPLEATEHVGLEPVEQVIAQALVYLQKIPPTRLLALVRNLPPPSPASLSPMGVPDASSRETKIMALLETMTTTLPAWLTADTAPNDWAVLAKRMPPSFSATTTDGDRHAYPLALTATGQAVARSATKEDRIRKTWRWGSAIVVMMMTILFLYLGSGHLWAWWSRNSVQVPVSFLSPSAFYHHPHHPVQYQLPSMATSSSSSNSHKALIVFRRSSHGGAAQPTRRLPWWRRFRRAVSGWFHRLWMFPQAK